MTDDDTRAIFEEHGVMDEVKRTIARDADLFALGFKQDEFGQFYAENCRVTLYFSCGEWELDISTPNSYIGCDIPPDGLHGKQKDES